jgi:hypothetical protein
VFGLIDRDFRQSNRSDWHFPGKSFRTFILPVHEIENYLLDSQALAASRLNTLKHTPEQIEDLLKQAAGRLAWWAACRNVVADLRRRFHDEFLSDPPCGTISNEVSAFDHICNSKWFLKLEQEFARTTQADVRQLLTAARLTAQSNLANGTWRQEFAGKEIYRDIGSRICNRTDAGLRKYHPSKAEFDIDLARNVADWQSANNGVPQDLADLLPALRFRIEGAARTPT